MSIPIFQVIPVLLSPQVTISLFSTSVTSISVFVNGSFVSFFCCC